MSHNDLEYGVLYHMEDGPNSEQIFDALRLGRKWSRLHDSPLARIEVTFRGDDSDFVGYGSAFVQGVHQCGADPKMLFLMGQLATRGISNLSEIWYKAFYFAQYNLATHKGRVLLGESSFLESPLKKFGLH